jgi:tRNA threonylcarbamoyladenosine biosynthesis protein TsaE
MPILDEHTLDFISHSPAQTRRFGVRLGGLLRAGDLICLEGGLGTGKTCLAQGIGRGIEIPESITSPSFTLIAEYRSSTGLTMYHIDLYRLDLAVEEALAFGLDDYLRAEGVCVIEWADRIESVLPEERLWITLRHVDQSKRGILMEPRGAYYDDLVNKFRKSVFGM